MEPAAFVYVLIPEDLGPLDRGAKYEDPLQEALSAARAGEITGGGSMLGDERPDGSRAIQFCGIDVDVTELEPGLALLRSALPQLGVPAGSELHYTRGEVRLLDRWTGSDWQVGLPREMRHPGFGS